MYNKVVLVGRLTKDPEGKVVNTTSICKYSIAVDRNFKNAKGEKETDFINITTFGKTADISGKYLKKGKPVLVEGRLQTGKYTNKEGQTIYTTDVIADRMIMLPDGKGKAQEEQQENTYEHYDEVSFEDAPF